MRFLLPFNLFFAFIVIILQHEGYSLRNIGKLALDSHFYSKEMQLNPKSDEDAFSVRQAEEFLVRPIEDDQHLVFVQLNEQASNTTDNKLRHSKIQRTNGTKSTREESTIKKHHARSSADRYLKSFTEIKATSDTAASSANEATTTGNNSTSHYGNATVTIVEEDPDPQNLLFGDSDIVDDDEDQAHKREYLTIAFMIGIFGLIVLIIYIRRLTEKKLNEILVSRLNSIMKDTIIVITVLTMIFYFEFIDLFDWRLNINGICLSFLAFVLSWLSLSTVTLLIMQVYCINWERNEAAVGQKETVLEEYKELSKKKANDESLTRAEKRKMNSNRSTIEYAMIRQEFIAPAFLPVISESVLRDDFNFALYLSYGLDVVLTLIFNLSSLSIVTAVVNICIWAALTKHLSYVSNTVALFISFGVLVAVLFAVSRKLTKIYNALVPTVDSSINWPGIFANFKAYRRDSFACAETRSETPKFLSSETTAGPQKNILMNDLHLPNRQERLFWLGEPKFTMKLVHCVVISQLIWTMIFIADYWYMFDFTERIVTAVAVLGILSLNIIYFIPNIIRKHAVVTHIQMNRNFSLIDNVILHQRKKIRSVLAKFYRLIKSLRKEMVKESAAVPKLKPFLEKQISDAFRIINNNSDSKVINIKDLKRLVHLCGKKVKKDELIYLARDSSNEDCQKIHQDDLIKAIEYLSQDVKLEPYTTTRDVLRSLAEAETYISIKELEKIIADHKVLSIDDMAEIIHELKYLSKDGQVVEIDYIAAYVRHNLECMPR